MNKYGLSRQIPEAVKRQVRQQCGFGCVICGLGIIQYEHVDPEFHEAKVHDPSRMTLLCPRCHSKVTNKMWSKQKVKEAMKNPKPLSQGFSNEILDIGTKFPRINFAGSVMENCSIPVMIKSVPLFRLNPLEKMVVLFF